MSGPIDRYLDELFIELRHVPPGDARSLLSETEAHLRDAADDAVARGMTPADAERWAVAQFGEAGRVADADRHRRAAPLWRSVLLAAWQLGAIGAIAVGVSGLVVGMIHLAGASDRFVASGGTDHLSAGDCSRWLRLAPGASSCAEAALRDWTAETISYRIAVGVLGIVALVLFAVARRRWIGVGRVPALPSAVTDTIAATIFVGAAILLATLGIDAAVSDGGHGAGGWLSAAAVAVVMGGVFGLRLRRDLVSH